MVDRWQGKAARVPLMLAISWLAVTLPAYAADEINITPLERQVAAGGRGIVTLRFEVENRSGQTRDWVEQLDLPDGWELISSPAPFALAAGAREVRLIHVSVPGSAASGSFPVRYSVSARDNGSLGGVAIINVRVDAVAGSELTIVESPSSLLAGEAYTSQFQLKNTGNKAVTYRLNVRDEDGYVTSITPSTLTLPPNEVGAVEVQGKIPNNLDESDAHKFTLIAKSSGKAAEAAVTIPIITRIAKGLGKYQTLPGQLKLSYSGQKNNSTSNTQQPNGQWQADYHAQGALDEDGKHRVELHARNGQTTNNTANQLQSEYQATYWNDEWRVKAGNHSFYTGRLSGNGVSGTGAEVTYTPKIRKGEANDQYHKPLEIRAFGGKSRADVIEQEKAAGAVINYRFDEEGVDVGASILNYEKQGKPKNTITSANAGWSGDNFSVRGEVAKDKNAAAQALDLTANWEDIGGNLSYQKTDPTFEGANQDTQTSYGGVNWRIDENTRMDVTARKSKSNLGADQTKEIRDDREQAVRVSRTLGDERNIEVTAGYRTRNEKDLRAVATTNRSIKAASLGYRHNIDDSLDLSAEWEQGKRTDQIKPSGTGSKQTIAARWHPEPDWDIGATYTRNQNLESEGNNTSVGVNGRYRFNQRRDFSGYLQRTKNNSDGSHSDSFQANYNHGLKRRNSINLSTTHTRGTTSNTNTNDTLWRVEYVMPLDVPIRKRTNIGTLGGFAYYADTDEPAKDLVLNLDGQYAVTDAEGKYVYPDIAAKDYQLQIDPIRATNANYMLGDEGSTRSIKVEAGKQIQVDLPLQPGASLTGNVSLFTTNKASVLGKGTAKADVIAAGEGLGGILLELQPVGDVGNRIVHKRITTGDGSFGFYGIAPGQWQLTVIDTDKMPEHTRLEQATFSIDLLQGDTQELTVRVLPTEQTIQKTGPAGGFQVSG